MSPSLESNVEPSTIKVLIIGGGITGLVLGQALKKAGVPYTIFEKDASVLARSGGWGLTIHWSLDTLIDLLPPEVVERLPEAYVDPEASKNGENGNFLFFDLSSGETKWKVPPSPRIRVSRERLRNLLLEGIEIRWGKSFTSFSARDGDTAVTAHFSDSSSATGALIVGADGTNSRVRAGLLVHTPSLWNSWTIPVRMLGVTTVYPECLALKMRTLDPFFFQGTDPKSDVYMWFSFLDTPRNNKRSNNPATYECQIMISWPHGNGNGGNKEALEVPIANQERLNLMKSLAKDWAEPFRDCVMAIPAETPVQSIKLEDFVPKEHMWDNRQGRVTLIGDAAHAMSMFRGEGANHSNTDVAILRSKILSSMYPSREQALPESCKEAIDSYEAEMIQRTAPAVLTSRRACLDAHEYRRVNEQSPLISRRVMVTQDSQVDSLGD